MIPDTFILIRSLPVAAGKDLYPVRETLKARGCRWDPDAREWFAPPGADLADVLASAPVGRPKPDLAALRAAGWVRVPGRTFDVRHRLKAECGAVWDPELGAKGAWIVAPDKLPAAAAIVASQPDAGRRFGTRYGPPRRRRYECPECGEMVTAGSQCWETGLRH